MAAHARTVVPLLFLLAAVTAYASASAAADAHAQHYAVAQTLHLDEVARCGSYSYTYGGSLTGFPSAYGYYL